jgi:pyruvate kinase
LKRFKITLETSDEDGKNPLETSGKDLRLNFSHGDHAGHAAVVKNLKEAMAQRPGKHVKTHSKRVEKM